MATTLVQLDIHLVFHTKSTSVVLREQDIPLVHRYIGGIIKNNDSIPMCVGGVNDHVHILCTLPKTVALSDFARSIKANSSRWIRELDPHYRTFEWQSGYGAFSVSPSMIARTTQYIGSQTEHHKKMTFRDEYIAFLEAYNIPYKPEYILAD